MYGDRRRGADGGRPHQRLDPDCRVGPSGGFEKLDEVA